MIHYDTFTLNNGLRFIVHHDNTTPMAAVNILYDVGSRDDQSDKTGFAHLFEHLMFGGSINIPKYDEPLQYAGGQNNAFTNSDITNYYLTLPAENIETAFWLESDRMLDLAFSEKSLEVQRQVVVEEFKQNYLNQPYGDVWLLLKPLAYKAHPYQWNTIGKDPAHIAGASLDDVRRFYKKFYNPNNAIVAVAGKVELDVVKKLATKWFGPIPQGQMNKRALPSEPPQATKRELQVTRNVPVSAIYKAWHMGGRKDRSYYAVDLISDLLGSGISSRLYQQMVRKQKLFSDISAYITGDIDPGLFVVSGKLSKGVDPKKAEEALTTEVNKLKTLAVSVPELRKVKNKVLSAIAFSNISVLNKAMNLCYYELLGNLDQINLIEHYYRAVDSNEIKVVANSIFHEANASTLYYLSHNNK